MIFPRFATTLATLALSSFLASTADAAIGDDYIGAAPPTVYEAEALSPQNADYDKENNLFRAHSGWYNDKLVHYYKFRIFAPSTYPGVVAPGGSSAQVPLQNLYLTTTTGDMSGVVGTPIIDYHHADGVLYSDFMEINLVTVAADYVADTYKSEGDIVDEGATVTATGIVVNLPVVPTGSTLADPASSSDDQASAAPISPTTVYYKGVQVTTYVFEVTDQQAADYFADTRSDPANADYAIPVIPFATATQVSAIPLWHVNQFTNGVSQELGNFGGPSDAGMRNLINLDRPDPGYSPLWNIWWMTEMPINYSADQASNSAQLTAASGFTTFVTPMYVNCPDIGAVSAETNPSKLGAEDFSPVLDASKESNKVMGSHQTLIFQADKEIMFMAGDVMIGTAMTSGMGAYEIDIASANIPAGTEEIMVVSAGETIRTIAVVNAEGSGAAVGGEAGYIDAVPPTVYEAEALSPQNADYDKENNMFPAHSGWYNDKLVHYYKFRIFAPSTYPGVVAPGGSSAQVPLQKLYLTTTTGDMSGVVGTPIIDYHHADGVMYSDFMEINLVTVATDYVADTYKSEGDVLASGSVVEATGIVVNLPVVPTGATLADPAAPKGETAIAPISPTTVYYKGVQVTTYVFEVTDQQAADYFADTRSDPANADYAIPVVPFATATQVSAIPLWHVNQFTNGVSQELGNFGGPSDAGMRNLINLDRPDPGYSPLWNIFWMTEMPINYSADQASNSAQLTPDSGFTTFVTPMYVNCPDIGAVSTEVNPNKLGAEDFSAVLDGSQESNKVMGSHQTLIFQADKEIMFMAGDVVIGTAMTSGMGSYEIDLEPESIPTGTEQIMVVSAGETIRTIPVVNAMGPVPDMVSDYIDAAPATVYEAEAVSPQNADYDRANNMFRAHSGWYNDKLVHYYKFRIFAPSTYPGVVAPGGSSAQVPLQKLYLTTTTGDMGGVVGTPIIDYHHADGVLYSDFMEVNLVTVATDYVADTYKSQGDIVSSGSAVAATGIVVNLPVVPTGATLAAPTPMDEAVSSASLAVAPIAPVTVYYKGVQVTTYVFEVTDQLAADYFAYTRSDPSDLDYAIPVVPFATATQVSAIPLWHVNQFTNGVSKELGNFGGPSDAGMRNLINLDRQDPGYSPLWHIWWMTEMPINYSADQASNPTQLKAIDGFATFVTPMYVNCPDIGAVGSIVNPNKLSDEDFSGILDASQESNKIMGSHKTLIFQANKEILFKAADGTLVGTAMTSGMGAYEIEIASAMIPAGTDQIKVVSNGETIRTIDVVNAMGPQQDDGREEDPDSSARAFLPAIGSGLVASLVSLALGLIL